MALDPKGQTAYFWQYSPDSASIWSVGSGAAPRLLGQTDTESTFGIYWRADGIVRLATSGNSAPYLRVWLTDFGGKTSLIEQTAQVGDALMTRDGQWLVELNRGDTSQYTRYKYTVVHAGTRVTVVADGPGELLGMTQDRSAVVYRPMSDHGESGKLDIHLLPINERAGEGGELTFRSGWSGGFARPFQQGVLAYTDSNSDTSELCTAALPIQ